MIGQLTYLNMNETRFFHTTIEFEVFSLSNQGATPHAH